MIERLETLAEKKAQEAEKLPAFDGINLLGLKRKIETILGLIGRDGIFDEYTIHDISHIDAMLTSLEWLIPDETKGVMSPADWLMTPRSRSPAATWRWRIEAGASIGGSVCFHLIGWSTFKIHAFHERCTPVRTTQRPRML